jgi:ADP-heptose:LPS heptosyltransferase
VRWSVGCRTNDAAPLTRSMPFRYYQHETMRALEVAGLAGAPPVTLAPRLAVTRNDLTAADGALAGLPRPLLAVHPGASDSRRRWPSARFAEVIAAAISGIGGAGTAISGAPVAGAAVIGTADEADLVAEIVEATRARLPTARRDAVQSLAGRLCLGELAGVLASSQVLLANDSGPRHLAEAVGTATVAIYWMGNVINAGPIERSRHRVHIAWTCACPVCGMNATDETAQRCEHDVSFVAGVPTGSVLADVTELLDV